MQYFAGFPGQGMPRTTVTTVQPSSHTGRGPPLAVIHGVNNNVESECCTPPQQIKPPRGSAVNQTYVPRQPIVANPPNMMILRSMILSSNDIHGTFHRFADVSASPRFNIPEIRMSEDGDLVEQMFSAMVRDFMEKSSTPHSANYSSDDDHEVPAPPDNVDDDAHQLLQDILTRCTEAEKDLTSRVRAFLSSIREGDLRACHVPSRHSSSSYCCCQGMCIYVLLTKYLRSSKYNAAVCNSKWPKSGGTPGGQHTYVDVILEGNSAAAQQDRRLIIDIDFCSEFQIARPTRSYVAATNALPLVFVGSSKKLYKLLRVMAREAKKSLKRNSMPIPPWRTLDYMASKWKAPSERQTAAANIVNNKGQQQLEPHHPCAERLQQLNLSMGV